MDHQEAAEITDPVPFEGRRDDDRGREPERGLVYEVLREFRALSNREE